jgi:hypothetical protein
VFSIKASEDEMLEELLKRLSEHSWFKYNSLEPNLDSLVKYLVNKLEERDASNHAEICSYVKEISEFVAIFFF